MVYEGRRKTLPSSLYGTEITIMERFHLTPAEIDELPADMYDEIVVRLEAEAKASRAKNKPKSKGG